MINPKILILPDIHGRAFYQKALYEAVDKGAEIVCLGDYLDPYPGDDLHERGVFAPLKELVEVKKQYPELEVFFTEGCVEYSRFADSGEITWIRIRVMTCMSEVCLLH